MQLSLRRTETKENQGQELLVWKASFKTMHFLHSDYAHCARESYILQRCSSLFEEPRPRRPEAKSSSSGKHHLRRCIYCTARMHNTLESPTSWKDAALSAKNRDQAKPRSNTFGPTLQIERLHLTKTQLSFASDFYHKTPRHAETNSVTSYTLRRQQVHFIFAPT